MDEDFHKAAREYADAFKRDPKAAEAILEKYKDKFKDFEKWAAAIRLMVKGMKIRKENPRMHIEDVVDRAWDA